MALYSESNRLAGSQQNLTNTAGTIVSLTAATGAATLKRGWIYEWEVGADGAPNSTDCAIIYDWVRQSTLGTGTSATPSPLDLADTAGRTCLHRELYGRTNHWRFAYVGCS